MSEGRSLAVQTILYGNAASDVARSAEAIGNSARLCLADGLISAWTFVVGDSSQDPVLGQDAIAAVQRQVESAGGIFLYSHFGANLGHGGGHNQLIGESDTDLVLFLNPDSLLAPRTLSRLLEALAPGVGAVDGRQLPLEHPKDYDRVTGDTSWASGACLLTTRQVHSMIGGFDHSTFFLYCDDVDYSWRIKLAGLRVVHQPAARVFHDKRLTVSGDIIAGSAEVYYSAEAALMLAYKWSRPEIVDSILQTFDRLADPPTSRAAATFRYRRLEGTLPSPIDSAHAVGEFVNGNYAIHRY